MEDWRRYYNEEKPHSGIGQKAPILLHNSSGVSSPSLAIEAENSSLSLFRERDRSIDVLLMIANWPCN